MGQVILHAFFKDYNYIVTDFLKMYPEELTKSALLFSINIILLFLQRKVNPIYTKYGGKSEQNIQKESGSA